MKVKDVVKRGPPFVSIPDRDYRFVTAASKLDAQTMKETHCYVPDDYEKELESLKAKEGQTYELPDGKKIPLGPER